MYSNPPMDYPYHTPSYHPWSIPPTYSTNQSFTSPTTPSFPSFPWELFTPYYTHGSSSPSLYPNHGYSPHPPNPNPYSSYSPSYYSYYYTHYHQQPHPTNTSSTLGHKYQNNSSIKKRSQKNSQNTIRSESYYTSSFSKRSKKSIDPLQTLSHPCFKKSKKKSQTLKSTKSTNITQKTLSTFPFLNREPDLLDPTPTPTPSSLPPNSASGSPLYSENWRNPLPKPQTPSLSETYESQALLNMSGGYAKRTLLTKSKSPFQHPQHDDPEDVNIAPLLDSRFDSETINTENSLLVPHDEAGFKHNQATYLAVIGAADDVSDKVSSIETSQDDLGSNSDSLFDLDFDSLVKSKVVPISVFGNLEVEISGIQHDSRLVLELRPISNSIYNTEFGDSASLLVFKRWDIGSFTGSGRYADDAYGRIWFPFSSSSWKSLNGSEVIDVNGDGYKVPYEVIRTCSTPQNENDSLEFSWTSNDPCEPKNYTWEGLKCNYSTSLPPRIVSLNLSRSSLSGIISPAIVDNNRPPSSWPSKGRIDLQGLEIRYRPNAPLVLKESVVDYVAVTPIVFKDGAVILGSKRSIVFEVDAKAGKLLRSFGAADFYNASTTAVWSGDKDGQRVGTVISGNNLVVVALKVNRLLDPKINGGRCYFSCVIGDLHYKQWDPGVILEP